MRLFLIRHGETPWTIAGRYQGLTDMPLSRKGIQQAKALARALKDDRPAFLYTSALRRARDTARFIGAKIGVRAERPCARDTSICRILQRDGDEVSNT